MTLQTRIVDMGAMALLIVLLGLGGWTIILDFTHTRQNILARGQLQAEQENDLNVARNKVKTLKGFLAGYEKELLELNRRIPDTPEIGSLLTKLHELIAGHKVEMIRFNHEVPVPANGFLRIPLNISLEGRFLETYRLIHSFETLNRLFVVESIQIRQLPEKNICRTELAASIFFKSPVMSPNAEIN